MALDFPSAPDPGDTFSAVGKTWKWDGITWKLEGLNNDYTLSAQDGSSTKKHIRLSNTVDTYDVSLVAGQNITLNRNVNEIEIVSSGGSGGSGSSTFTGLNDTPSTFTADKWIKVNSAGNALEWVNEPAGDNTTYGLEASQSGNNPIIRLAGSDNTDSDITLSASGGIDYSVNIGTKNIQISSPENISDLGDVNIVGQPSNNAILKFNLATQKWMLGSDNVSGGGSGVGNLQQVTDQGNTTTNSITTQGLAMGSFDGANNKITLGDNSEASFFYQQSSSEFITQVNNGNDWLIQITPSGSFKVHGYQSTEMIVAGDNGTKLYHKSGGVVNPVSSLRLETTILGAKVTGELEAGGNKYPISTGNPNEVLMTNGAGQLSWTAQTGGGGSTSPAGSDTQIQFNDSGSFGADGSLTFTKQGSNTYGKPLLTIGDGNDGDCYFDVIGGSSPNGSDKKIQLRSTDTYAYLYASCDGDFHIEHNRAQEDRTPGAAIKIGTVGDHNAIFVLDGESILTHADNEKIRTTTDGIKITGGIQDKDSQLGNPGQILSSTGTQLNWIDAPTGSGGTGTARGVYVPEVDKTATSTTAVYTNNDQTITFPVDGSSNYWKDVKFKELEHDKVYEFRYTGQSTGTGAYWGWFISDNNAVGVDGSSTIDSNGQISENIRTTYGTSDRWICVNADHDNSGDNGSVAGDTNPLQSFHTGGGWINWSSPENDTDVITTWHIVIDMPRRKVWVKQYYPDNTSYKYGGGLGPYKWKGLPGDMGTSNCDPTDPTSSCTFALNDPYEYSGGSYGTNKYYFNFGCFVEMGGTGTVTVEEIPEKYSAFRNIGGGSSSGGATTFLALTDTPNSYDNEKWLRSTTSGLEWVAAPTTGEDNVKSDWDATSGDAEILNKPTNVSEFTNDAGYKTTDSDTTYTIDLIQSGNTPVADEVKFVLTDNIGGTDVVSLKAGTDIEFEGLNASGGSEITIKSTAASNNVTKFTDLSDTPAAMSSAAGMYLRINSTENGIEYANVTSGGGGGLQNIVEDTTPQLGGNLDVNGKSITSPTGTMYIDAYNIIFRDTFNGSSSYKFAEFNYAGPTTVKLYGGLAERFRTTQSGCKVTGELEVTGDATANLFIGDLQGNADTATNLNTSSASKQLLYQIDGTTTGLLPAGTSGWILQSQGSGNAPAWVENTASGSFTDLSDTPSSHDNGKWLKSNGSNLVWADEPQGLPQGGASLTGKILRHDGTEWVIADLIAGGGIDIETTNNTFTINGMLVLQMQSFSGTGYHYPHAKTKGLLVVLVGGGGGSGSATGNSSFSAGTGGGGGAAAAVYFYTRDQYTNAQNQGGYYSCGSGGAGGVGQNDNGDDGDESTLQVSGTGPTLRASGGKGSAGTGPGNYSYGGAGGSHPYGGGAWPHHICFGVAGGHSTGYGANAKEGEPGITNAPGCAGANWGSGGGGIKSNSGNTNNGNSGVGGRIDIYEF